MSGQSKLAAFGAKVLESSRLLDGAGNDVDGGDIQEWALDTGCLVSKIVHAPCSEDNCVCAEVSDFPTECYFVADDVLAFLKSLTAYSRVSGPDQREKK
jgi:hypothetical protein